MDIRYLQTQIKWLEKFHHSSQVNFKIYMKVLDPLRFGKKNPPSFLISFIPKGTSWAEWDITVEQEYNLNRNKGIRS